MSNNDYKIHVCIRARPILPHEIQKGLANTKLDLSNPKIVSASSRNGNKVY